MRERMSTYNGNALKIGLFGANCSSGRAVTRVPERWSGNWPDNLRLARMADDAGLDFLLPIARWKGYGGDTDYQGATLETVNWASGLLASTRRITPFGGTRPVMMNAGASDVGRAFALRNCEAFFTNASRHSRTETENKVRAVKAEAEKFGREIDVYTVGVVTCRPTRKDAEERYRYCAVEQADWSAVDLILAKKNITKENHSPEDFKLKRTQSANGMGRPPLVVAPDQVAQQ